MIKLTSIISFVWTLLLTISAWSSSVFILPHVNDKVHLKYSPGNPVSPDEIHLEIKLMYFKLGRLNSEHAEVIKSLGRLISQQAVFEVEMKSAEWAPKIAMYERSKEQDLQVFGNGYYSMPYKMKEREEIIGMKKEMANIEALIEKKTAEKNRLHEDISKMGDEIRKMAEGFYIWTPLTAQYIKSKNLPSFCESGETLVGRLSPSLKVGNYFVKSEERHPYSIFKIAKFEQTSQPEESSLELACYDQSLSPSDSHFSKVGIYSFESKKVLAFEKVISFKNNNGFEIEVSTQRFEHDKDGPLFTKTYKSSDFSIGICKNYNDQQAVDKDYLKIDEMNSLTRAQFLDKEKLVADLHGRALEAYGEYREETAELQAVTESYEKMKTEYGEDRIEYFELPDMRDAHKKLPRAEYLQAVIDRQRAVNKGLTASNLDKREKAIIRALELINKIEQNRGDLRDKIMNTLWSQVAKHQSDLNTLWVGPLQPDTGVGKEILNHLKRVNFKCEKRFQIYSAGTLPTVRELMGNGFGYSLRNNNSNIIVACVDRKTKLITKKMVFQRITKDKLESTDNVFEISQLSSFSSSFFQYNEKKLLKKECIKMDTSY